MGNMDTKHWVLGLLAAAGIGGTIFFMHKAKQGDKAYEELTDEYLDLQMGGSGVSDLGMSQTTQLRQQVGSLFMPRDASIQPHLRVGLIQAQQRYRPRHGVTL